MPSSPQPTCTRACTDPKGPKPNHAPAASGPTWCMPLHHCHHRTSVSSERGSLPPPPPGCPSGLSPFPSRGHSRSPWCSSVAASSLVLGADTEAAAWGGGSLPRHCSAHGIPPALQLASGTWCLSLSQVCPHPIVLYSRLKTPSHQPAVRRPPPLARPPVLCSDPFRLLLHLICYLWSPAQAAPHSPARTTPVSSSTPSPLHPHSHAGACPKWRSQLGPPWPC